MTKKQAQRIHARARALERYGIECGPATRTEIIRAIQTGTSKPLGKKSLRSTKHEVALSTGEVVRVAYDRHRKELITFLSMPVVAA